MQNEKRKALLEHESAKIKECDEALQRELREWKAMLMPRKQVNMQNRILISPDVLSLILSIVGDGHFESQYHFF